jgi:alkylation response protein AidB-like acyl-CoA dehydrogenase
MKILDRGRISIAALALGLGYGALAMAVQYAKDRKQFGKAIARVPGHPVDARRQRHRARRRVAAHAPRRLARDAGQPPLLQEASMAKLYASEAATRACNRALQIHGGYGYTREFAVERHLRDAKLCEIGEGTSEVQRIIIAKHILAG